MRLALIADIHGNLPALEKVLAELDRQEVDQVLCLGDVAVGPQPVETLERLDKLGCPTIMGNWDACMLGEVPKVDGELAEMLVDACTWSAEQLSSAHREFMRGFQPMVELAIDDELTLLAFHGSPRSYDDEIFATTPEDELDQMLEGYEAAVFAGGHTHFQMFRRYRESVVVNPGSIGQSFRRRRRGVMRISPWAEYCLVGREDGRLTIELRRTPIDVEEFIRAMRRSGMPHAERWAELWAPEPTAVG
jgi:predicted phosphodiesterase